VESKAQWTKPLQAVAAGLPVPAYQPRNRRGLYPGKIALQVPLQGLQGQRLTTKQAATCQFKQSVLIVVILEKEQQLI
jgi:hypothetical protein